MDPVEAGGIDRHCSESGRTATHKKSRLASPSIKCIFVYAMNVVHDIPEITDVVQDPPGTGPWIAWYGHDVAVGVTGAGESQEAAIIDFQSNWLKATDDARSMAQDSLRANPNAVAVGSDPKSQFQLQWLIEEFPDGSLVDRGFVEFRRLIPVVREGQVTTDDDLRGGITVHNRETAWKARVYLNKSDYDEAGKIKNPVEVTMEDGSHWWHFGAAARQLMIDRGHLTPIAS